MVLSWDTISNFSGLKVSFPGHVRSIYDPIYYYFIMSTSVYLQLVNCVSTSNYQWSLERQGGWKDTIQTLTCLTAQSIE